MSKPARTTSPPAHAVREAHPGWWTVLAILPTAWIGIPMALPLAAAAPWILFRRNQSASAARLTPATRWALATFLAGGAMFGLAGERAIGSVPWGHAAASAMGAWIDGSAGAVPSWLTMALWSGLFLIAASVARGWAASLVLAHALLVCAVHASVVLAHSANIFRAGLVALPVWSMLLLAGMTILMEPLAPWVASRIANRDAPLVLPKRLTVGVGLLGGAFLARLLSHLY